METKRHKNFTLSLAVALLIAAFAPHPASYGNVRPTIESFTFTPNEVELTSIDTNVTFKLVVSHPSGIKNTSVQVDLSGPLGSTLATTLMRSEAPINFLLKSVTFVGNLNVPRNILSGVYGIRVSEVNNNSSAGYEFSSGAIPIPKERDLIGGENALLVRNNGELNFGYDTFVGPTHNTQLAVSYNNASVYNNNNPPIWKVGEMYDPTRYFESRVPNLPILISSTTPEVCVSDGMKLKLILVGNCTYKVFTKKTKDYASKEIIQNVTVTAARVKPDLVISSIASQTSRNLPKTIEIFRVYSPSGTWVLPKSDSPGVCIAADFYVQIVGGGTCTLTYQSEATTSYLASDLYKVSFEVTRDPQTITFSLPTSTNLSNKTVALSATASSGGSVLFITSSPDSCSVTGSTLNLLKSGNCSVTATQPGTSTIAPISATATVMIAGVVAPTKKTITCLKGKKTKKVSGTNPKCPKGYKVKR